MIAHRISCRVLLALSVLGIVACSSAPPVLTINARQTLVLESSVSAAGIKAETPVRASSSAGVLATSRLNNTGAQAVRVYYRFYWYDAKGLDILPYEDVRAVVVPSGADIHVQSVHAGPDVHQVRLHLFL